jgi:hypothetical protein
LELTQHFTVSFLREIHDSLFSWTFKYSAIPLHHFLISRTRSFLITNNSKFIWFLMFRNDWNLHNILPYHFYVKYMTLYFFGPLCTVQFHCTIFYFHVQSHSKSPTIPNFFEFSCLRMIGTYTTFYHIISTWNTWLFIFLDL